MQSSCQSHALLPAEFGRAEQCQSYLFVTLWPWFFMGVCLIGRLLVAFRHCVLEVFQIYQAYRHQTQNYNFDFCLTCFVFGLKFVSTRCNGRIADLYVLVLTSKSNLLKPCLHLPPWTKPAQHTRGCQNSCGSPKSGKARLTLDPPMRRQACCQRQMATLTIPGIERIEIHMIYQTTSQHGKPS